MIMAENLQHLLEITWSEHEAGARKERENLLSQGADPLVAWSHYDQAMYLFWKSRAQQNNTDLN